MEDIGLESLCAGIDAHTQAAHTHTLDVAVGLETLLDLATDSPDPCTWQESALWHRLAKMSSTALADVIIKLKRELKQLEYDARESGA